MGLFSSSFRPEADYAAERARMVAELGRWGRIRDSRVLAAMASVPREEFVLEGLRAAAYEDRPLPIGQGQTISQPLMIAIMLEAAELAGTERVLEVGTGSGYQAALLGLLGREVYTVEIVPELAEHAARVLREQNAGNVTVITADGSGGWPEAAPYDAILVAAAAPQVPAPLVEQLAEGGRLIIPVGEAPRMQVLVRVRKVDGKARSEELDLCAFVPLIGEHGVRGTEA
jgi:protein-L-isoaspartate(D-aspartate) O-methyltransferase